MFERYPIHRLIETRRASLGIGRGELARQLRIQEDLEGPSTDRERLSWRPASSGAKRIIDALPAALETSPCEVEKAVKETADIIARARAEDEAKRDAAWRESFVPNAYLVGTASRPSSITIYGMGGGAERWLKIPLDLSQPPVTFAAQALAVVRCTPTVPFFGATKGFIVNFTPHRAVEFDTTGNVIASFDKAYRPGEVEFFIGKQKLPETWLVGRSIT
jgi:hypothetical protein